MATILVVDDDEDICTAFRHFLTDEGHTPLVASNASDALAEVRGARPDLVILDIRMPGVDGLQALRQIREAAPDVYVIMMTAYGTSQTSIEAARLGAFESLTKPLDLDVVRAVVNRALESRRLGQAVAAAEGEAAPPTGLVGTSPPMQEAYKLIGRVAGNDLPVLVAGERGVGKRLVAGVIHAHSRRKDRPLVTVSCRALPEAALTDDLFGPAGQLAAARGGTLILEDIDGLSLPLQARLLRVLPADGGATDPRIIATTREDLADEVEQGTFNAELHDRLRLITIALPPLRERREDLPALVALFVQRAAADLGKTIRGVDPRVIERFADHPWPGNVGELEHVVRRASVLAAGEIVTLDDLGDSLRETALPGRDEADATLEAAVQLALQRRLADREAADAWPPFHDVIGHVEKILVREALATTSGNQVRAAELLGLNRTTLRKKMRLYRL